jgi:hypothetical protein
MAWAGLSFLGISYLAFTIDVQDPENRVAGIVAIIFASICLVFLILELIKPLLPKETEKEKQALMDWLAGTGYRSFVGRISHPSDKLVSFELKGSAPDPFPSHEKSEGTFGNYEYWDYRNYRVVKRLDGVLTGIFTNLRDD